jgi:hypothetical protein
VWLTPKNNSAGPTLRPPAFWDCAPEKVERRLRWPHRHRCLSPINRCNDRFAHGRNPACAGTLATAARATTSGDRNGATRNGDEAQRSPLRVDSGQETLCLQRRATAVLHCKIMRLRDNLIPGGILLHGPSHPQRPNHTAPIHLRAHREPPACLTAGTKNIGSRCGGPLPLEQIRPWYCARRTKLAGRTEPLLSDRRVN